MKEVVGGNTGRYLLKLARTTIKNSLSETKESVEEADDPSLGMNFGTFVTLKIDGKLRGCIGNIEPVKTLNQGIRDNALNAAFHDHRFSSLSMDELKKVHIGISILSAPKPLEYEDGEDLLGKLRPGVEGVILRLGKSGATFLPQVWDQLPDPELFMGQLCLKAGLSRNAWRDSQPEILIYQVQSFEEEGS